MSVIRSLSLGISANARAFQKDVEKSIQSLNRFGASIRHSQGIARGFHLPKLFGGGGRGGGFGVGSLLGPIAAIGGTAAIGGFFHKAIEGASDLQEQATKIDYAFGKSGKIITATANKMARDFGIPKQETLEAASNIGLIAKGAGYTSEKAAQLGSDFSQLAADASSFYNVPVADALEKIRAGLVGESEPLRTFGVLLSEEAVKARGYAMGLAKVGTELTQGQKVQARAAIIQRSLATASGDLARTMDSPANAARALSGRFTVLATDLGEILMPAWKNFLGLLHTGMDTIQGAFERNKGAISGWATVLAEKLEVGRAYLKNFPLVWDLAVKTMKLANLQLVEDFKATVLTIGQLANYIPNIYKQVFADLESTFFNFFKNMTDAWDAFTGNLKHYHKKFLEFDRHPSWKTAKALFWDDPPNKINTVDAAKDVKPVDFSLPKAVMPKQTDAMKALAEDIAKSSTTLSAKVAEEIARAASRAKLENALSDSIAPFSTSATEQPDELKKKNKHKKKANNAAVERGTKEAYSAIAQARKALLGDTEKKQLDTSKKQLAETTKHTELLQKISVANTKASASLALNAFAI